MARTLWLLIFLLSWSTDSRPALGELAGGGAPAHGPPPLLQFQGGRLTGHFQRVPLQAILEAIAQEAQIEFVVDRPLRYAVTGSSLALPIEEAIAKLLRQENYVALYRREGSRVTLQKVWVFAREQDTYADSAPLANIDEVETLRRELASPDPLARHHALSALGMQKEVEAVDVLLAHVADQDPDIRRGVLGALVQSEDPRAVEALASAVIHDGDPGVRQFAAVRLAELGRESAVAPLPGALRDPRPELKAALTDPDPNVRKVVRALLERFQE